MRRSRRQGFTLVEVLISLAIVGATAAALGQLWAHHVRQLSRQEAAVERRQEGRAALAVLLRELSLAGFPDAPDPACHASMALAIDAEPSAVRFLANLYGVGTVLAAPAAADDARLRIPDNDAIRAAALPVSPGGDFSAGDAVYLHDPADGRVECHRLDRAGRSGELPLAAGDAVRRAFPAGSRVEVINLVRYAHAPGTGQLVRSVDGSSQAVADRVASVTFALEERRVAVRLIAESHGTGRIWQALVALRNGADD